MSDVPGSEATQIQRMPASEEELRALITLNRNGGPLPIPPDLAPMLPNPEGLGKWLAASALRIQAEQTSKLTAHAEAYEQIRDLLKIENYDGVLAKIRKIIADTEAADGT